MKTTAPNSENLEVRSEKRDQDSSFSIPNSYFSPHPPALVPNVRFPEFRETEGWETKMLGRLCRIRTGKKDANEGASDGLFPFFTCAENHIFSQTYSFDAEAILIAGNANVGQTRYYRGKFEAYQRTYVLTDFSGIDVPYLYSILNAKLRESLLGQVQVSAMSYIKLPMLQEYPLPVPPSPAEQQKIAECLSSVDDLMAAQARKVDALKTHKKGLMQQLFPREGETQPRLRFPEFQNAGEWAVRTMGSLASFSSGGTPSKDNPKYWNGSIPWVSASSMYDLVIERADHYVTPLAIGNGTRIAKKGAILILVRGSMLFKRVPICIAGVDVAFNQDVKALDVEASIDTGFLLYQLSAFQARFPINETGIGAGKIELDHLKGFELFIPDTHEQHRIASCLSSLDALITAETQKLDALKTHKRGLMQQLFPSPEESQ